MYAKYLGFLLILLGICACSPRIGLQGIPQLNDGTEQRWKYQCDDGNIVVEYANRGGQYSATLDSGAGLRVLTLEQQGNEIIATLPPLAWVSSDGIWFDLHDGDTLLLSHCRAIEQTQQGNANISLGRIFSREQK